MWSRVHEQLVGALVRCVAAIDAISGADADPALAEKTCLTLLEVDSRQAEAAPGFVDRAPPAPPTS